MLLILPVFNREAIFVEQRSGKRRRAVWAPSPADRSALSKANMEKWTRASEDVPPLHAPQSNFKDVQFYLIMSFGLFCKPPLEDVPFFTAPRKMANVGPTELLQQLEALLGAQVVPKPNKNSPPKMLAIFGPPS